jgi:hypothetical protein
VAPPTLIFFAYFHQITVFLAQIIDRLCHNTPSQFPFCIVSRVIIINLATYKGTDQIISAIAHFIHFYPGR